MKAPSLTILEGDCIEQLKTLPDESVHCCVTSPPYWGLRDYGVEGQIGLEKTPEEYVAKMVEVFREVKRVLRGDGTCWVNLGDSYATGSPGSFGSSDKSTLTTGSRNGAWAPGNTIGKTPKRELGNLKPKDLCGIPWRVAFALQADGWWLRQDIIWHKCNPMPESVTDRCTKAHEYIFLLTKRAKYFFDAEAIKEKTDEVTRRAASFRNGGDYTCGNSFKNSSKKDKDTHGDGENGLGRNRRSVWTIPSQPYSEAHFATFPEALVKPCILAGTSARGCCPKCWAPWERVVEKTGGTIGKSWHDHGNDMVDGNSRIDHGSLATAGEQPYEVKTTGWTPTCDCGCTDTVPCTVIDIFGGSFTTCQVALELGRNAVGIELNPEYVKLASARCAVTPGLALA